MYAQESSRKHSVLGVLTKTTDKVKYMIGVILDRLLSLSKLVSSWVHLNAKDKTFISLWPTGCEEKDSQLLVGMWASLKPFGETVGEFSDVWNKIYRKTRLHGFMYQKLKGKSY